MLPNTCTASTEHDRIEGTMHYTTQEHEFADDSSKRDELPRLCLYDILGGDEIVSAIIDAVYERMIEDRTLLSWCYFLGHNTSVSKNFQLEFFSLILIHGLPSDSLKVETALIGRLKHLFTLGLNERSFDVMIGHLVLTLESFRVTRLVIIEVVRTFMPLRRVFEAGSFQASSRQNNARWSV